MKHADIIQKLNLEQKCALLSGETVFTTRALPGKGIPAITPFGRPQRCPQAGRRRRPSGPQPQRSGNLLPDLFRHCVQLG